MRFKQLEIDYILTAFDEVLNVYNYDAPKGEERKKIKKLEDKIENQIYEIMKKFNDDYIKIKFLKETTPKEILEVLFEDKKARIIYLEVINEIWEKTAWDKSIINAFLLYVLNINNSMVLPTDYLYEVVSEWKEMNINTVDKAVKLLNLLNKEISKDTHFEIELNNDELYLLADVLREYRLDWYSKRDKEAKSIEKLINKIERNDRS